MLRNLILVLSAFTSLIALVSLVDGALIGSASGVSRYWMLGVIVVGALCWLRWRWAWKNTLLVPALLVGAATLIWYALAGMGDAVQISPTGSDAPQGLMDVLLGAQATLILAQLWSDRRRGPGNAAASSTGKMDGNQEQIL